MREDLFFPSLMGVQGWDPEPASSFCMYHYLKMGWRNGTLGNEKPSLRLTNLPASSSEAMKPPWPEVESQGVGTHMCCHPEQEPISPLTVLSSDPVRRWPRPSGKPESSIPTCRSREWWCTKKRSWRKGRSKFR